MLRSLITCFMLARKHPSGFESDLDLRLESTLVRQTAEQLALLLSEPLQRRTSALSKRIYFLQMGLIAGPDIFQDSCVPVSCQN